MKQKDTKIQFTFSDIKTVEFASVPEVFIEDGDLTVESNFEFGLKEDIRRLLIKFNVFLKCNGQNMVILKVACYFDIEQKVFETFRKDNQIIIPKALLTHLAVLTVGTARGVFHVRIEKTKFSDIVLPTINITEMITGDLSFDIK